MKICKVQDDKKRYRDLLLLADEQEDMINRYLERGTMYVLEDDGVKAECVVTDEKNGMLEIKNIATDPNYQGRGYARALIDFVCDIYKDNFDVLQVGTEDSPCNNPVLRKNRFCSVSYRIEFLYR